MQKSGATYGSKKATAGATIATVKARTGKSPPLVPTDARTKLNGALLNPDTVNKALKLIAAYQNVLEACYAPSSSSPSRRQVPTLVETMSRELGWTIEESMRELVEAQVEQGEREGGLLDDGEDHTSLADEWYEAAPEYCSRCDRVFLALLAKGELTRVGRQQMDPGAARHVHSRWKTWRRSICRARMSTRYLRGH